jgi:tetratricopeptide (TPR) repeat protein
MVPAPWLHVETMQFDEMKIVGCWPTGSEPSKLVCPRGWKYEESLSKKRIFLTESEMKDRMLFLRREEKIDVYLDLAIGKEVHVGRPVVKGDEAAAVSTQLEAILRLAWDIEAQMQRLESRGDKNGRVALTRRMNIELLPQAERIIVGPGRQMSGAHFAKGIVLRILGQREEAERSFRRANELQPGVINTLLELVRCLGEQDKSGEALPFAREAVSRHPKNAGVWGNLAMVLIQCGDRVEARKAIDRAVELDPQDSINRGIRDNFESYLK